MVETKDELKAQARVQLTVLKMAPQRVAPMASKMVPMREQTTEQKMVERKVLWKVLTNVRPTAQVMAVVTVLSMTLGKVQTMAPRKVAMKVPKTVSVRPPRKVRGMAEMKD